MYVDKVKEVANRVRFRTRNHERILDWEKQNRKRLRDEAVTVLGSSCKGCGIDNIMVLQVDHIDGGGNVERHHLGNLGVYRRVIRGESGYQLLCANCNIIKKIRNNEVASPRRKY